MKQSRKILVIILVVIASASLVIFANFVMLNMTSPSQGRIVAGSVAGLSQRTMQIFAEEQDKLVRDDSNYVTVTTNCEITTENQEGDVILSSFPATFDDLSGAYIIQAAISSVKPYPCSALSVDSISILESDETMIIDIMLRNTAPADIHLYYSKRPEIASTWSRSVEEPTSISILYAAEISQALLEEESIDAADQWRHVKIYVNPLRKSDAQRIDWAQQIFDHMTEIFGESGNEFLWRLDSLNETALESVVEEFEKTLPVSVGISVESESQIIAAGDSDIVATLTLPIGLTDSEGNMQAGKVKISFQQIIS